MTIDAREVHIAAGKLLQFIEAEKMRPEIASAALRSAAQTTDETMSANSRLLMLAQIFRPQK